MPHSSDQLYIHFYHSPLFYLPQPPHPSLFARLLHSCMQFGIDRLHARYILHAYAFIRLLNPAVPMPMLSCPPRHHTQLCLCIDMNERMNRRVID